MYNIFAPIPGIYFLFCKDKEGNDRVAIVMLERNVMIPDIAHNQHFQRLEQTPQPVEVLVDPDAVRLHGSLAGAGFECACSEHGTADSRLSALFAQ